MKENKDKVSLMIFFFTKNVVNLLSLYSETD